MESAMERAALAVEALSGVSVDGPALLTERAELLGLPEPTTVSANGTCRMLPVADGWIALNLARPSDLDLLPAWLAGDDRCAAAPLVARAQELGLPAAVVRPTPLVLAPDFVAIAPRSGARTIVGMRVVDLSALWAGPLAGSILAEAGCEVVKVESTRRPEATGPFHERLNGRKEQVTFDFTTEDGLRELHRLVDGAHVVITSARRRAVDGLGFDPDAWVEQGDRPRVWVSISGYGWSGPEADRVAFGDDAAAAAGLVAWQPDGTPHFVGDAIADPSAGLHAAAEALAALGRGDRSVIDVSLRDAAAYLAADDRR